MHEGVKIIIFHFQLNSVESLWKRTDVLYQQRLVRVETLYISALVGAEQGDCPLHTTHSLSVIRTPYIHSNGGRKVKGLNWGPLSRALHSHPSTTRYCVLVRRNVMNM